MADLATIGAWLSSSPGGEMDLRSVDMHYDWQTRKFRMTATVGGKRYAASGGDTPSECAEWMGRKLTGFAS